MDSASFPVVTEPRTLPLRVLVAKPGLDGHDRGAKVVARALRARGIGEIPVYAGGIIPDADLPTVRAMGVRGVYGPGTPLDAIVQAIRDGALAERATRGL